MSGLYGMDVAVFRAIHIGLHSRTLDPVFWLLTWLGDGTVQTVIVFLFLYKTVTRPYFWPLLASLVLGGILGAQGLKHLVPRDRPSNLPWAHPQEPLYYSSFPSGHTTSSFAIAIMLVLLWRCTPMAKWAYLAVVLATLVGLSRIYRGVHWPTDVLGGALCGTGFASITYLAFGQLGWLKFTAQPVGPKQ